MLFQQPLFGYFLHVCYADRGTSTKLAAINPKDSNNQDEDLDLAAAFSDVDDISVTYFNKRLKSRLENPMYHQLRY